ncbi:MAG: cytochrome c oxidase subunit [Thermoanaerobaculia bacterium]|nr:cytochrome c oxidase subunit [Thermoanaerobaculia bacterium]
MTQRVLDVSALTEGTADSRALIWWGNLGMLAIEGTMFAMAMATYLYLRSTNLDWPPSTVPKPDLVMPTINAAMLLLSCIAAFVIDRASITKNMLAIRIGHIISIAVGLTFLYIQFAIIVPNLGYKWSDHAYGSIIWVIIGMHALHMVAATGETALLFLYSLFKPVTKKHLLDFRCTAVYWYFVALVWVPFYFVIFIEPWMQRKGS